MQKNKLLVIACYFGNLPWYFDFFLDSCRRNTTVDFLLLVDDMERVYGDAENIKFEFISVADFAGMINTKLDITTSIIDAYKFCDFRPAFGMIFKDYLVGYDFWGHCDIDVIFGDIRAFITDELCEKNDIICVRPEYVTGFFSLFRNNHQINTLYKESKDYDDVFTRSKHFCFDECNFLHEQLSLGAELFELPAEVESITHVITRMMAEGKIRAYFDLFVVENTPGEILKLDGKMIYKRHYEILLYHLICFKSHPKLERPNWSTVPNRYAIEEYRFQLINDI